MSFQAGAVQLDVGFRELTVGAWGPCKELGWRGEMAGLVALFNE